MNCARTRSPPKSPCSIAISVPESSIACCSSSTCYTGIEPCTARWRRSANIETVVNSFAWAASRGAVVKRIPS